MLDVAGVATLENLINYGYLKDEIVAIDEHNKIDSRSGEEFFKVMKSK